MLPSGSYLLTWRFMESATSTVMRWFVFLQCAWNMMQWFSLLPVLVFCKKVLMSFTAENNHSSIGCRNNQNQFCQTKTNSNLISKSLKKILIIFQIEIIFESSIVELKWNVWRGIRLCPVAAQQLEEEGGKVRQYCRKVNQLYFSGFHI